MRPGRKAGWTGSLRWNFDFCFVLNCRALETLGITENRYSGIPTIQRVLREAGMREAVFTDSRNEFAVTFYNGDTAGFSQADTPAAAAILDFCAIPRSRKEIADFLGISTYYYMMHNYINPLLEGGQLRMTKPETPRSKNQKYVRVL